jgi:integral membrane sensor domain MASE1
VRLSIRPPLEFVVVFAAYVIAGKVGQATGNIRSTAIGPVWPAYGVALAAFLLCGRRAWLAVGAAALAVALSNPVPWPASAGQAAGTTAAALLGAALLKRVGFDPALSRLRDALALLLLGALGSGMVSAIIGVAVLMANGQRPYSGLGGGWLIYWLGDATGVLLITPLVLTARPLWAMRARLAELCAQILLLAAVCFVVFHDLPVSASMDVLAFAVLPFIIWAAVRFGVSGVALSTLLVAGIATVETALGSGPFVRNSTFANAVLLDVFFGVLSVSGLALAAVIAEREQAERERERLVGERAALAMQLRLAAIVESSEDAIIGADSHGVITDWNVGAEYP